MKTIYGPSHTPSSPLYMRRTCKHVRHMGMIQIRNVPDDLHRTLKAKAAMAGLSLSDYMLDLTRRIADRPSWAEIRQRLDRLPNPEPPPNGPTSAEIVRDLRGPLSE